MADDTVEARGADELRQRAARPPNRERPARANLAHTVHRHAERLELAAQPAVEAERELLVEPGAQRAITREGDENRLDSAIEVAAVDVKQTHQVRRTPVTEPPRPPASAAVAAAR